MAVPSILMTDVRRQDPSSTYSSPAHLMSPKAGKDKSAYNDSVCLRHKSRYSSGGETHATIRVYPWTRKEVGINKIDLFLPMNKPSIRQNIIPTYRNF